MIIRERGMQKIRFPPPAIVVVVVAVVVVQLCQVRLRMTQRIYFLLHVRLGCALRSSILVDREFFYNIQTLTD